MTYDINIVGPSKFQNELMASFIQNETGLACVDKGAINCSHLKSTRRCLVLWDMETKDFENLWSFLDTKSKLPNAEVWIALFNAPLDKKMQKTYTEAIRRGVHGIFFKNEPLELLPKGIQAILKGEFWLSRDFLNQCVYRNLEVNDKSIQSHSKLTEREKEILLMVSSGTTNEEVAENLNISYHTVKTHLTNIYRKIDASNRLQASFWATKNL